MESHFYRYAFGVLALAAGLVARRLLDPLLGDDLPFGTLHLAVAVVAWYSGVGPSVLIVVLGSFAATYLFVPPRESLAIAFFRHRVECVVFVLDGLALAMLSGMVRAARQRALDHAREVERKREQLEQEMEQRRRLEDSLRRAAAELEEADRRKDDFITMLAHELRGPLGVTQNAAHVLRVTAVEQNCACRAGNLIERQVQQMARLVDDLLDVSRIARGKMILQFERLDVAEVIELAVEACQPVIAARKQELIESLPRGPVWLEADPVRLTQVISNLLCNAAKYTPERGRIELSVAQENGEVVLRVQDNGAGISPDALCRVFDLFSQDERTLAQSQGGLGVGLTLVRGLVEMHRGTVEAHSEGPGRGSEFVVRLPTAEPCPDQEAAPQT